MVKQYAVLFAVSFSAIASFAQPIGGESRPAPPPPSTTQRPRVNNPRPVVAQFAVTFQANHDFYLVVNNTEHGKISRETGKTVKLQPGRYKVSFEEADSTGEKIEKYFRVTPDMVRQRDTTYAVFFKNDYFNIIKDYPAILPNQNRQKR